ncbi:MAG: uncharacterized protein A8A55_1007 [Amphiamblys sp. WSBS2006]|nr:MAG: uncharacterized protein A8A55_1007 [Amphiamblys sp. WSBS2006]
MPATPRRSTAERKPPAKETTFCIVLEFTPETAVSCGKILLSLRAEGVGESSSPDHTRGGFHGEVAIWQIFVWAVENAGPERKQLVSLCRTCKRRSREARQIHRFCTVPEED